MKKKPHTPIKTKDIPDKVKIAIIAEIYNHTNVDLRELEKIFGVARPYLHSYTKKLKTFKT
ncbi:hypothetical protein HRbin34_00422 [bacterium HR34]|nr:hypothetical protein HRbin34_00422 [bacterium HR34]